MKFPSYARTFKHIVHKTGFAGLKIPAQAFKKFEPLAFEWCEAGGDIVFTDTDCTTFVVYIKFFYYVN